MREKLIGASVACLLMGGCLLAACSTGEPVAEYAVAQPQVPERISADDYEAWIDVRDSNPVDEEFAASLSSFSYRTASAILGASNAEGGLSGAKDGANSAYSPISLYYALAFATQGAAGTTAQQMDAVLGAPDAAAVPGQSGNLFRQLASDPDVTVDLANSIWLSKDYAFEQGFVDVATQQFYATPFSVEFGTAEADDAMAGWINEHTNGTIDPQVKTEASQMASIVNTVYFKGSWLDTFDASNTSAETFHAADGDVSADFMKQRIERTGYLDADRYARASLSFRGGAQMTFVLPAEGVGPQDILADAALLEEAFGSGEGEAANVTFTVPKGGFDSSFDLIPALESLGMKAAFGDEADFSNLSATPAYISSVKQESHIAWDEEGAEASAYTSIGMSATSSMPEELEEVEFTLDRPFLFEIRSSQGVPLFIGLCGNPSAS